MNPISQIMMAAAFAAGLAAAVGAGSLYDRWIDDPAVAREAREEGARAERGLWQKEKREAEAAAERRLAESQAKINAADLAVEMWRKTDRLRAAAFEAAMKEQRDEDGKNHTDRSGCDLPDRVWEALR